MSAASIADAVPITRQTSLPCRREDLESVPFAEAGMSRSTNAAVPMVVPRITESPEPLAGRMLGPVRLSDTPASIANDHDEHDLRIRHRRSAAGMVMRGAKPVQRMPEAKLLGASRFRGAAWP